MESIIACQRKRGIKAAKAARKAAAIDRALGRRRGRVFRPVAKRKEVDTLSVCKGCGAKIKWIRTIGGKKMPVDPEAVFVTAREGSERFVTDEGAVISGRLARLDEVGSRAPLAYVPHWKTCPNAADFRQKRK